MYGKVYLSEYGRRYDTYIRFKLRQEVLDRDPIPWDMIIGSINMKLPPEVSIPLYSYPVFNDNAEFTVNRAEMGGEYSCDLFFKLRNRY